MARGRKPGYKHSRETRDKISQARTGSSHKPETREKIRQSMSGRRKSKSHRDAIADSVYDLERKCMRRFLDLRASYPGYEDFFDAHREELLLAVREMKTESELRDIRRYFETNHLGDHPPYNLAFSYQYSSSSCHAQEDAMIDLLDARSFLRKILFTSGDNPTIH